MLSLKKILNIILLVLCIITGLVFILHQTSAITRGPEVEIVNPINGLSIDNSFISIEGRARHVSELRIQGLQIVPATDGSFQKDYILSPGLNRIHIYSRDRFGKVAEFYQEYWGAFLEHRLDNSDDFEIKKPLLLDQESIDTTSNTNIKSEL